MSFTIEFTEEQLNNLISDIKHNEQLLKLITEQKESILKNRKRKRDETEVREKMEKKIKGKLTELYKIINDKYRYMGNLLDHFSKVHTAWFFGDLDKIKKYLDEIDKMNEKELVTVKKNLLDIDEFDKSLGSDEGYVSYSDIYWRHYTSSQMIIKHYIMDTKDYMKKYSVKQLDGFIFDRDFDDLYDIVTVRHEHTKKLYLQARDILSSEDLKYYRPTK